MPKYILILLSLISVLNAQNYWLPHSSPTSKDLVMCSFPDSVFGWVCGDSGLIMKTTNSGGSWVLQNSGITVHRIEYIFFLNNRLGWALSNDVYFTGSLLLKTSNGGINWIQTRFPDTSVVMNVIHFTDSLSGYISGETGQIFRTTDGGINWLSCTIDPGGCNYMFAKKDLYFVNAETGYSCGGAIDFVGLVWRTTNRGVNWHTFCLTPEPLNEIQSTGPGKVAAMGGDFDFGSNVAYSGNSGVNWVYNLTDCFGAVTGFSKRTPAEWWAVQSFANVITVNLDSMKPGTHWICLPSPDNVQLYDIEFLSPSLGYVFGKNGKIYKYNNEIIGISSNQNIIPLKLELSQNYPNPFNPETIIEYDLPVPSSVELRIFDVTGRLLRSFYEGYKGAGNYSIKFSAADLSSGVYFYSLITESGIINRKMIVLK